MRPRCVQCRYQRDGLRENCACPECGEPALEDGCVALFGSSTEWSPWWGIAWGVVIVMGGARLFLMTTIIQVVSKGYGSVFTLMGVYVLYRAMQAARRAADGGDILWLLQKDRLEVRTALRTRIWQWSELQSVLYELGWQPKSVRLSVVPRAGDGMVVRAPIWLNSRTCDTRAVQAVLQARIGDAKVAGVTA